MKNYYLLFNTKTLKPEVLEIDDFDLKNKIGQDKLLIVAGTELVEKFSKLISPKKSSEEIIMELVLFVIAEKLPTAGENFFSMVPAKKAKEILPLPKATFLKKKQSIFLQQKLDKLDCKNYVWSRTIGCLRGADIEYVWEVALYSKEDLFKLRNFGKGSFKCLTEVLTAGLGKDFENTIGLLKGHVEAILNKYCDDVPGFKETEEYEEILRLRMPGADLKLNDIDGLGHICHYSLKDLPAANESNNKRLGVILDVARRRIRQLLIDTLKV